MEPASEEDEDAIIERRRQLRQAIVNKYHQSAPTSPHGSNPTPPSEANSSDIGERLEDDLEEEEEEGEEGEDKARSVLTKKDVKEEARAQEELKKKKTSLLALRESVRNMFDEENHFTEKQLVRDAAAEQKSSVAKFLCASLFPTGSVY